MRKSKSNKKKSYTAIPYNGYPSEMLQLSGDPQCRVCALMPNYCGKMNECHGEHPFIYVESQYSEVMSRIM